LNGLIRGRRPNRAPSRSLGRERSLRPVLLAGVLILAAVLGYKIEHAPAIYRDSALVVFEAQITPSVYRPNSTVSGSLITTGAAIVEDGTGPQAQALVRAAGGTAYFKLSLLNLYNQDFPEYSYPIATLVTQAARPAAAQRTLGAVLGVLRQLLAARQARVSSPGRISSHALGTTGPVTQPGSLKRALAALAAITLIAMGLLSGLLGRLPALRRRMPGGRGRPAPVPGLGS
jgi:hypothetical protein